MECSNSSLACSARPHTVTQSQDFLRGWEKPCLVMFSDKCPITRDVQAFFVNLIPSAGEDEAQTAPITIHGAGHFLQEDR